MCKGGVTIRVRRAPSSSDEGDGGEEALIPSGSPTARALARASAALARGLPRAAAAKAAPREYKSRLALDLVVLRHIWFSKLAPGDHKARLEKFYAPQAHAYDAFRSRFLWGREPMLAACAARLRAAAAAAAGGGGAGAPPPPPAAARPRGLVWVDLGGGTAENVALMARYMDLACFEAIYVVDLCGALCAQARAKAAARGWRNVVVVEGDACAFAPPGGRAAQLVTFSYSLSMIPAFHAAVDAAAGYLDPAAGLLGACDFFVSARFDLPLRQQPFWRRVLWRAAFDTDNIDVGPERRAYLDHRLARVWEHNGDGTIPWTPPPLRAPYYAAVYRAPRAAGASAAAAAERRAEAPPLFPPTFLYTQSWEDPAADAPVLRPGPGDVCLTLTSGGCNSLELCLAGAAAVHSVDCNPAQSALLELKAAAVRALPHADAWALFGEGRHARAAELFARDLAPLLSQGAARFWARRLHYFTDGAGLYSHGAMGRVARGARALLRAAGLSRAAAALAAAPTLEAQRAVWDAAWPVRAARAAPRWAAHLAAAAAAAALFNPVALWFGAGVPAAQRALIAADGAPVAAYAARAFDGVARHSHLAGENYFYLALLTGRFTPACCPAYLKPEGYARLQAGAIDALHVETGFFMDALRARTYTRVVLLDHADWLGAEDQRALAAALGAHVAPGGRVIFRSAALEPAYAALIAAAGFDVACVARADRTPLMDRVNTYASFYVAVRHGGGGADGASSVEARSVDGGSD